MRAGGEGEKVWDLGRAPKKKKVNISLTKWKNSPIFYPEIKILTRINFSPQAVDKDVEKLW